MLNFVDEFSNVGRVFPQVVQVTAEGLHGSLLTSIEVVLSDLFPAFVLLAEIGQEVLDRNQRHLITLKVDLFLDAVLHQCVRQLTLRKHCGSIVTPIGRVGLLAAFSFLHT